MKRQSTGFRAVFRTRSHVPISLTNVGLSGTLDRQLDLPGRRRFIPQAPQELFKIPAHYHYFYDVAPDGERFVMMKSKEGDFGFHQPVVVINGFKEVKEKVPVGK